MYAGLLIGHLLGASVWIGGHLYLCVCLLPTILKHRDVARLLAFEQSFERLGMGALLVQVVTGVALAHRLSPNVSSWLTLDNDLSRLIMLKFIWLGLTVVTALHAQLRVIPRLSEHTLPLMAGHVCLITLLSLAFLLTGVGFRFGLPSF